MRLLNRKPDETDVDADADADDAEPDVSSPADDTSARKPVIRRHWGRRTVTVPVTVPERSVRRTAVVSSRSIDRVPTRSRLTLGPLLAMLVGAGLAVVGSVALLRAGIDRTWFQPEVEVLDADHTALLAMLEMGAGALLVLVGAMGNRVPVAVLGLAMALGATVLATEPNEVHRQLAIETWWAWTLAAAGVVLTLAALQTPHERRSAVVDVS